MLGPNLREITLVDIETWVCKFIYRPLQIFICYHINMYHWWKFQVSSTCRSWDLREEMMLRPSSSKHLAHSQNPKFSRGIFFTWYFLYFAISKLDGANWFQVFVGLVYESLYFHKDHWPLLLAFSSYIYFKEFFKTKEKLE